MSQNPGSGSTKEGGCIGENRVEKAANKTYSRARDLTPPPCIAQTPPKSISCSHTHFPFYTPQWFNLLQSWKNPSCSFQGLSFLSLCQVISMLCPRLGQGQQSSEDRSEWKLRGYGDQYKRRSLDRTEAPDTTVLHRYTHLCTGRVQQNRF